MPERDPIDVSVSEVGSYKRTDDGPADDTITMNRDTPVEQMREHEPTPPPAPRSRTSSTNVVLPGLRDQIQAPPPAEPSGMSTRAKLAVAGGLAGTLMLLGLLAVGAAWWTLSSSDDGPTPEQLEDERRKAEEAIGVPVRDGLSNKKKRKNGE